jgi:hypothetical protein
MTEKAYPIEISICDIPSVKYDGEIYRVFNSEKMRLGGDYIITDIDSDDYIDIVEEIHWDALYIRNVSDIADIEGLSSLIFLKKLELFSGTISEIIGLERLANLEELDLSHNKIKNTSGLQTLVNLKKLHLNDNHISEVKGLRDLRNLKELYLNNNQFRQLDGQELPLSLEVLSLKGNDGIEIKNLSRHRNLRGYSR